MRLQHHKKWFQITFIISELLRTKKSEWNSPTTMKNFTFQKLWQVVTLKFHHISTYINRIQVQVENNNTHPAFFCVTSGIKRIPLAQPLIHPSQCDLLKLLIYFVWGKEVSSGKSAISCYGFTGWLARFNLFYVQRIASDQNLILNSRKISLCNEIWSIKITVYELNMWYN